MIIDQLSNAPLYDVVHPRLKKGFDFLLENGLNLETNMGEVVGNLSNGTLHYANTYDITKNWVGEMYNYNFDYRTHWFAMEKGYVGCLEGDNDIK